MHLTSKAVQEFQDLARRELGLELAEKEARRYAESFLAIFAIACRPIPKGFDPPPKNKGHPVMGGL